MTQQTPPVDKNTESYFRWAMLKENLPKFYEIAWASLKKYSNTTTGDIVKLAVELSNAFVDELVKQNGAPWATPSEVENDTAS